MYALSATARRLFVHAQRAAHAATVCVLLITSHSALCLLLRALSALHLCLAAVAAEQSQEALMALCA
jgi:hypothetical protein